MDEKLYRSLQAQVRQMEVDVFAAPPADFFAFQERLGRYRQLIDVLAEMREQAKKDPDE